MFFDANPYNDGILKAQILSGVLYNFLFWPSTDGLSVVNPSRNISRTLSQTYILSWNIVDHTVYCDHDVKFFGGHTHIAEVIRRDVALVVKDRREPVSAE